MISTAAHCSHVSLPPFPFFQRPGPEREAEGGCIADLVFSRREQPCNTQEGALHLYTFVRRGQEQQQQQTQTQAQQQTQLLQQTQQQQQQQQQQQPPPLTELGMAPGDMVLLSLDGLHAAVGRVTVHAVGRSHVTVAARRPVRIERYERQWRALEGGSGGGGGGSSGGGGDGGASSGAPQPRAPWRLDKDEIASMSVTLRTNLLRLVLDGGAGSGGGGGSGGGSASDDSAARLARLRELIIDLAAPRAHSLVTGPAAAGAGGGSVSATQPATMSSTPGAAAAGGGGLRLRLRLEAAERYLQQHGASLNAEQAAAVRRVAGAEDYALILGMPGTGKTSTIAAAIRALVAAGARVLVSAYTNSAVDNVLLKLAEGGEEGVPPVPLVRLGRAATVHPGVRRFAPGGAAYPDRSAAALAAAMDAARVVGVPCLSCSSPLLAAAMRRAPFDVAIVDEAGQATLPAVLGPLMLARAFVLVGDHYQLSPLVVSARAAEGGLGASLFRRLCEAHPQAVTALRRQYRMNDAVMALPNALVYSGQLAAGSAAVAAARLELPAPEALARHPAWVRPLLDPALPVAFLDTDPTDPGAPPPRGEAQLREGTANPGEAAAVAALVAALLDAGLAAREVGVASPYRAQVLALQAAVGALRGRERGKGGGGSKDGGGGEGGGAGDNKGRAGDNNNTGDDEEEGGGGVEVLTVDRYQGRDKAAVILSLVRSNPQRAAGQLLADWQRLNVAVTRARRKLLIVGSASTVASVPLLAQLVAMAREGGWLVPLPPEATAVVTGDGGEA